MFLVKYLVMLWLLLATMLQILPLTAATNIVGFTEDSYTFAEGNGTVCVPFTQGSLNNDGDPIMIGVSIIDGTAISGMYHTTVQL